MSAKIKPSEVSVVLLRQLHDIDTHVQFEEVGIVLSIGDGVARIHGLTNVTENELVEFENGVMGVAMNLEEDNVGVVLMGASEGIKEGQVVKRTGRVASIEVSEEMLGRVINPLGQPLDGGPAIGGKKYLMPAYMMAYAVWRFVAEILRNDYRGATVVDFLTPSQFISVLLLAGGLLLLGIEMYVDHRKTKAAATEDPAPVGDGEAPAEAHE